MDIDFIQFYIKKRYNQSLNKYFNVSKPVVSIWKNKKFPTSRQDEFIRKEKCFDIHELFERIYKRDS